MTGAAPAPFGALSPLLAPRSIAVIGASEREGNLGGLAVGFLRKFGFGGQVWPVNTARNPVAGLPCFGSLDELPGIPDLAIVAVPADAAIGVVGQCVAARVPAAVVWAGGFAEAGAEGAARQCLLEAACRGSDIKLCGPNCIGVINTSLGMTASFSSLMTELDHFTPGVVSMVSQSGGIAVTAHARAQELGFGFRVTVSCGNEATLTIADFIQALVEDEGTRVIAVYTEGLSDAEGFVAALAEARRRGKPVVVLKGGASEPAVRAALAHTGRLAGVDRTFDAIFREMAAIRVHSTEELVDVCLQLASLRPGQLPGGNRVLLSSFGGGGGVLGTDQCVQAGLAVPPLDEATRQRLAPIFTPLGSSLNPVDFTPGSMTNLKLRADFPKVLRVLAEAPDTDMYLFLAAGFGALAPLLVEMLDDLRRGTDKPLGVAWQSPPAGIVAALAALGIVAFNENARMIRAAGHLARYAADMRHRIGKLAPAEQAFAWGDHVLDVAASQVVSENVVAGILEAAGLPVAKGRITASAEAAVAAALEVGFPVAIKGISAAVTHRAAAGLLALDVSSAEAVASVFAEFTARAAALGVTLDGCWVQHMFDGNRELLVTAFRDRDFGIMVGCGIGGGATELIDDVVFGRAPIGADGAADLLGRMHTLRRLPGYLSATQQAAAAAFIADFSQLAASAPWPQFTLEVNPLKLSDTATAAVDGLLLIG